MIKIDIPMPQSCGECFAFNREYRYCILFSYGIPARHDLWPYEKPDWCEIKEAEGGET